MVRLLARVGARRLGDAGLPVALGEARAAAGEAVAGGDWRAGADAAATVALHVFNGTRDRDDAGVVGARRAASAPRDAADRRPLLLHAPGHAWVRIALDVDAGLLARATDGAMSLRAEAGHGARLLCYRRHDAGTACAAAVSGDLARFASALSAADVLALGVGDACAVAGEGTLSFQVAVAWEALLGEALDGLGAEAGAAGPLLVEVPADARASLSIAVEDGTLVAFARQAASGERAFRVVVRRRRAADRRLEGGFAAEAGFADPAAVSRLVQGALAEVLGVPAAALRAIRDATAMQQVPRRHRPVAAALAERFGIAGAAPLARLRERLESLDARLAGRIEAVARTRVAVALEAEYRRLATDAVLLEAELPAAAVRRVHPALLRLDTDAVHAARGGAATASLLRDRTVERWTSWGVAASVGSWFEFASGQQRRDKLVARRRIDADGDTTRREYLGATRYAARANGWSTAYGATFEARDDGTGAGMQTALHLWWEEGRLRADANGLARIVDDARLWGVVDAAGAPALLARLHATLDGVGRCRPRLERVLDRAAAPAALHGIAAMAPAAWGVHAARALPRNARVAARADCGAREAAYAALLAALGDVRGAALRKRLATGLRATDPRLAARERDGQAPWTAWRVLLQAGLAAHGPAGTWRSLADAAARLDRLLASSAGGLPLAPAQWQALADAFGALRPGFEQPFLLRTLASALAVHAPSHAGGTRLAIAFERGGKPRTLLVTPEGAAAGTPGRAA